MKKILFFVTALLLVGCAAKPQPQTPFSLLAPKQLSYNGQILELAKAERQNAIYTYFIYQAQDKQQLHYMLSSMIMPLDKLQATLAEGAKQKQYRSRFKQVGDKLYALSEQKEGKALSYQHSVSTNSDCGTLTVIHYSTTSPLLLDEFLAGTLDQMKCEKNQ